ncbi:MAG: class I SAM-dependent methyltransferase [Actinobacteria bacterium]|nr:class I SAM-dependent methyltransferase [Actinomycetota bacterium]NBQ45500.1 class I SAM-dependent methyltransferase [Actinomycetota bacterium]
MKSIEILKKIWRPIYRNRRPIKRLVRKWRVSKVSQANLHAEQIQRFSDLGLDWQVARDEVERLLGKNTDISSHRSEHYELLMAISIKHSPKRILEIGTAEGDFTSFLALIFPDSEIETIDLPSSDSRFWNATTKLSNTKSGKVSRSEVEERDAKLQKFSNIRFREMNSLALTFQEADKYDLIWVDGDHTYPVVSVDIANALRLLNIGGILGFDDIYETPQVNYQWVGQESYETLVQFNNAGLVDFKLILKKLFREKNYDKKSQKFIAIATRKT